jgi:hypothetical protein
MWTRRCRLLITLLTAALLAGTALAATAEAGPAPYVCAQNGRPTGNISGGVTVPAGIDCVFQSGQITGPVTIGADAQFSVRFATVVGDVSAASNGFFDAEQSVVRGSVTGSDADDLTFFLATVTGSVTGSLEAGVGHFAQFYGTPVQGRVDLTGNGSADTFESSTSSFGQGLSISHMWVQNLDHDTVDRYLRLANLYDNTAAHHDLSLDTEICGDTVNGDLTVTGSTGYIQLGASPTDYYCSPDVNPPAPLTINGSLLLFDNTAVIHVAGSISGDAVCRRDTPHPRAGTLGVTVAGNSIEDCAAFA